LSQSANFAWFIAMFLRIRFGILLALSLFLAACAIHRPTKPQAEKPAAVPAQPQGKFVGTVTTVNDDYHFVMIESYFTPKPGTALKVLSPDGVEIGVLTVSPENRRPFIIANIVKGSPQKGDQVFE
jgi:hypothetical protein